MTIPTQARAEARALLNAVLVGAAIGTTTALGLTSVFLVGGMAHDAVTHSNIASLRGAATAGFSQDTLMDMAQADPGATQVALRYDPNLLTGYAPRDAGQTELAARLDAKAQKAGVRPFIMRASYGSEYDSAAYNPAARPFRSTALDQSRQLDCLTQAVYYEARGETPAGQAAVAQVVLNRVRHPAYPKSICAVVYQGSQAGRGCQFSFACDGSLRRGREIGAWNRAEKVATRALNGHVMDGVGNSTHFHVTNVSPAWGPRLVRVNQIGMHVFYRFGGRSGGPGAFTAQPREDKPEAIFASLKILPADAPTAAATPTLANAVIKADQPASAQAATPKADAIKDESAAKAHNEPMAATKTNSPSV